MGCLSWLIVGALGGWIASFIVKVPGRGLVGNIIAGIIGGLLAGWVISFFTGTNPMSGIDLTSIIVATIGAIVVSAAFSWFMGRGKSTASQVTSGASNMVSSTTSTVKDSAAGAGAVAAGATAGAVNLAKDTSAGAVDATQNAAASAGGAMQGATAAVAGAAGAMNMDQMMGALNGVFGGGKLDVNSPLGQMITPIADSMTAKLGLPKEVGAMVVAFALAKLGELMKNKGGTMPSAGGAPAVNTDEVLGKLNSGGGIDTGALDSMGLSQELADKTGLSKEQAGQGLQYAMGALSAGMSGQKTFEGANLPDMSMLTGMMPK